MHRSLYAQYKGAFKPSPTRVIAHSRCVKRSMPCNLYFPKADTMTVLVLFVCCSFHPLCFPSLGHLGTPLKQQTCIGTPYAQTRIGMQPIVQTPSAAALYIGGHPRIVGQSRGLHTTIRLNVWRRRCMQRAESSDTPIRIAPPRRGRSEC